MCFFLKKKNLKWNKAFQVFFFKKKKLEMKQGFSMWYGNIA